MSSKHNPARLLPAHYPRRFTHRVLYSDMDAFRHLNNVAIARYFEEGRADFNVKIFGAASMIDPPDGLQLLFASSKIDFLQQAYYPGMVEIGTGVVRIGSSSYIIEQAAFQAGKCFALGEAVMVKAVNGRPTALTPEQREAKQALTTIG